MRGAEPWQRRSACWQRCCRGRVVEFQQPVKLLKQCVVFKFEHAVIVEFRLFLIRKFAILVEPIEPVELFKLDVVLQQQRLKLQHDEQFKLVPAVEQ